MERITVAQIKSNQNKIDNICNARSRIETSYTNEIERLQYKVYQPKIDALVQERDNIITAQKNSLEATKLELDKEIGELHKPIEQVKRILMFLQLESNPNINKLIIDDAEIEPPDKDWRNNVEPYRESLGYLFDDDYLKIKIFVINNDKPKNKYSLIAVGKSLFHDNLLDYPYSYSYYVNLNGFHNNFKILIRLQDASSIEELKVWFDKHKTKLFIEEIKKYQEVKTEYLETLRDYKTVDFQELITYTCPKCNNFHTTFDSEWAFGKNPQCFNHSPYIDMEKIIK